MTKCSIELLLFMFWLESDIVRLQLRLAFCHFRIMLVSGVVQIRPDGTARLELAAVDRQSAQPAQTGQGAQVPEVPTVQSVFDMIQGGDLELHATRGSITKSEIRIAMSNIQRQLKLLPGPNGNWNDECWERFRSWLQAQKRPRRTASTPLLALPAPPLMALPPPPLTEAALDVDAAEAALDVDANDVNEDEGQDEKSESSDSSDSSDSGDSSDSNGKSAGAVVEALPDLTAVVQNLKQENGELTAKVTEMDNLKQHNEDLITRVAELEDEMAETEAWAKDTEEENYSLKDQIASLKAQLAEVDADCPASDGA